MSGATESLAHVWPWIASGSALAAAIWRWWKGRAPVATQPRPRFESTEDVMFPSDSSPRPGRGLARWLSAPVRLALKEAGEQALQEEIAGLRDDLKRTQADNKRLRAELDFSHDSSGGSTSTDGASRRRRKPPSPPLEKSAE